MTLTVRNRNQSFKHKRKFERLKQTELIKVDHTKYCFDQNFNVLIRFTKNSFAYVNNFIFCFYIFVTQ